jgi:hypothetical protein
VCDLRSRADLTERDEYACILIGHKTPRATDKRPQWRILSWEAWLLVPEFAMIHDFQIKLFEKGEIVSKREGWDEEWREVGRSHGWQLPPPAPWPLRLWGIRYVRAAVASARLIRRVQRSSSPECFPTGYGDWVIYAIARGWC